MPRPKEPAPPMLLGPHTAWYHGSALQLETLRAGSTVTPVMELARAFSHRPTTVNITIRDGGAGHRVIIQHDGKKHEYLYKVLVDDPAKDLRQHPGSGCAPGEEIPTTRDLLLPLAEGVPLDDE